MKRLSLALILLTVSVAQAQSISPSPVYKTYINQLVQNAKNADELDRQLMSLTSGMGSQYDAGVKAAQAYVCMQFADAAMKKVDQRTLSSKKFGVDRQDGTLSEVKDYCGKVMNDAVAGMASGSQATEKMATFGANNLRGQTADEDTLVYGVALDLYLAKNPDLKSAALQRGSMDLGTAGQFQSKILGIMNAGVGGQQQAAAAATQQAQSQDNADRAEIVQGIQADYKELSGIIAAGDKLAQKQDFQGALMTYATGDYISQKAAYYKTEIAKRGLSGNITLGGKSMTLLQAADLLNTMAASATAKIRSSAKADTAKSDAIDAAMAKAANATLKGDRLTAYKRIGLPYSLSPAAYMGPDVKKTAVSMQNAKVWEYHNSWSEYGGFTCDIRLTFNGNKLVSRNISTNSIVPEAQSFCRNKYNY